MKANLERDKLQTDKDKNLIMSETQNKLNILAVHFETVHSQNDYMGKSQLSNIIKHKINQLRHEIIEDKLNNRSICTFNDTNTIDKYRNHPI